VSRLRADREVDRDGYRRDVTELADRSPSFVATLRVVLTLFVPCVAQFSVMLKERGTKTALAIFGFIFPFAFLVGYILRVILGLLGVRV